MKLNINRKEALAAARKAAMAAMDNSPVLELTGILMVANEDTGQVAFSGTDLITAIRCELQADVEVGGSAVVNAQLLIGMLNLTAGDRVSMELLEKGLLRLKCQTAEYTVAALNPDILTKIQIPVPDTLVRLTGLRSLDKFTTFAAAKKDEKQQLECVRIEVGKSTVRAIACDGSRMTETIERVESGGSLEFLLPAKSLHTLAGLVEDKETVYLGLRDHSAVFFRPGLYFTSRIVEAPYLDFNSILAVPGKYRALTQAETFRPALETACAAIDGCSSVQLCFHPDKTITLCCDGPCGILSSTQLEAHVLTPMPKGTSFYYKAADFVQGIRLLDGIIALAVSETGVLIAANGSQKYMLTPRRPVKRVEKSKAEESPAKKSGAKKKTSKTKKTAAKAA